MVVVLQKLRSVSYVDTAGFPGKGHESCVGQPWHNNLLQVLVVHFRHFQEPTLR